MKILAPLMTLATLAACLACCAPLLLPLLGSGALVMGGGLGLGWSVNTLIGAGVAASGLAAGLALWARQRRARARHQAACACDTACPTASCQPGSVGDGGSLKRPSRS